jgi:hypothetical protein
MLLLRAGPRDIAETHGCQNRAVRIFAFLFTRTSRMFALGFVPVSEMGYDSRADRKEIIDIR